MNVAPGKKAAIYIAAASKNTFRESADIIAKLAYGSSVSVQDSFAIENAVSIVTADAKIYIPLGELVNFEEERRRLNKEKDAVLKKLSQIENKLSNQGFLAKAPAEVIEKQRTEQAALNEKLNMLDESLAKLG